MTTLPSILIAILACLLCNVAGALVVLSTLPGDCFSMIDLWDAWRRGEWPTVSRMADRDRWLQQARKESRGRDDG